MPLQEAIYPWAGNQLLEQLPPLHYRRLLTSLTPVELRFKKVLSEANATTDYYYFPLSGCVSALNMMEDGRGIEVGIVGNEGVTPFPVWGAHAISPNKLVVQHAGQALRISQAIFQEEAAREGPLWQVFGNYQTAFLRQVSQSVACNGLHNVQQRCCRWLLMMHDKCRPGETMTLTHEFFAIMLGVRRSSVTEVLNPLQKQGLLSYHRGMISILDRPALETLACECYRIVRDEYAQQLSPVASP